MGYIRRKMKISRRVKRTKTNTRKRKQNRTFRKNRRVNRGGADKRSRRTMEDKWEDTRTEKEKSEEDADRRKKVYKSNIKRVANKSSGLYLEPGSEGDDVNQEEQLETADRQTGLMDDIDAETEGEPEEESDAETDEEERPGKRPRRLTGGPIMFGGKKKRSVKK